MPFLVIPPTEAIAVSHEAISVIVCCASADEVKRMPAKDPRSFIIQGYACCNQASTIYDRLVKVVFRSDR